jgi:RNA polymerase sigma-70 factor, ECF subfamily
MGIGGKSGVSSHGLRTPPRDAHGSHRLPAPCRSWHDPHPRECPRTVGPAGPGPYLHQALRNTHVSSLRTRDRRPVLAPLEPEDTRLVAPAGGEPVEILHTREVIDAIRALPQAQREVVAAVDVAGLGYSEAATHLQIPVGTVMSRLHRGRARLATYAEAA